MREAAGQDKWTGAVNAAQRYVLTAGAVAAIATVVLTPRVVIYSGTVLRWTKTTAPVLAPIADVRTTAASLSGVMLATALLWMAVASRRVGSSSLDDDSRLSAVESRLEQVESLITEPSGRR